MSGKLSFLKIMGVALAIFAVVAVSCRPQEKAAAESEELDSVTVGGVEVSVRVSDRSIRTSERLSLTLTVKSDPDYKIQLPEVPEKLGSFFVLESQTVSPRLNDAGQMVIERSYTLEPDEPGVGEIPEFLVVAVPDPDKKAESITIQSKPVSVNVVSVLTGDGGDVREGGESGGERKFNKLREPQKISKFRDIAPDTRLEVLVESRRWPLVALISNVVVVLCLLVVWLKWKKSGENMRVDVEREWVQLASASPEEKRRRLESVVAAWVAQRFSLPLRAVDFQGVDEELQVKELIVPGWDELVIRWNQFQYGAQSSADDETETFYQMWDEWMRALPDPDPDSNPMNDGKERVS